MKNLRIGTRDSALALWQAEWVRKQLLTLYPEGTCELVPMKTKGDKILDVSLAKIGDKGLFTKELEQALLRGEIDLAVHSLKDMPTELPEGLDLAAFCEREAPWDVLLSKGGIKLENLPYGTVIGTSSLRRKAQLLHYRRDLEIVDLRGNLQTRWEKLQNSKMQGIVLAAAGVKRLGWEDRITEILSDQLVLPAVGQGCVVVEIASERNDLKELLTKINHLPTEKAVQAERSMMHYLAGGCQIPVGALGRLDGSHIHLQGMVANLDGSKVLRTLVTGENSEEVGRQAGISLMEQGAGEILAAIR